MPRFNDEGLALYKENEDLMDAVHWSAQVNHKWGADDTEHNKILKMTKYATFNAQLSVAQLGWAKAYARRNNLVVPRIKPEVVSSTQSVVSSTNSLSDF
jgi:hypothetical protein